MKGLLLLVALLFCNATYCQDSKLLASCCEGKKEAKNFGRCSGDAYCTACTSCRYCKHCSAGGTCGVCAPYTPTPAKSSRKKSVTKKSFSSFSSYNSSPSYSYGDKLIVMSENLNLREYAETTYDVIEKLHKGDVLTFLSFDGEWIEVRVVNSGNKGYVYAKYIR